MCKDKNEYLPDSTSEKKSALSMAKTACVRMAFYTLPISLHRLWRSPGARTWRYGILPDSFTMAKTSKTISHMKPKLSS